MASATVAKEEKATTSEKRLRLIDRHELGEGIEKSVYEIEVRTQIMCPLGGMTMGIWMVHLKPHLESIFGGTNSLVLQRCTYRRISAHISVGVYRFEVIERNGCDVLYDRKAAKLTGKRVLTKFEGLEWAKSSRRELTKKMEKEEKELNALARRVFDSVKINETSKRIKAAHTEFCTFDFWEEEDWWRERVPDLWGLEQKRATRLFNQLTRVMMQNLQVKTSEQAATVLARMPEQKRKILNRMYVEPIQGSLFASYISTIFMHNKQQHGLNTKHAAAKAAATQQEQEQRLDGWHSVTQFDAKIHLDMCASCDKREIFELMLQVERHETETTRHARLCLCETCKTLRDLANAWQYFDCGENVWLRLEFNRRFYARVCSMLEEPVEQGKVKLVFTSYKNEFNEEDKFITNFVNYYSFYENGEQPVTIDQCTGQTRQMVSTIFLFAKVNWKLIEIAMKNGISSSSISLNQQSLFKSLNNTLYSIFSENSIYRMSKETEETVLNINAPYVNRGLGALPNCGVNAFTADVSFSLVE